MGLVDEVLKNKEELVVKLLQFLEGKEAATQIKLDGMQFNIGNVLVKLSGEVDVTVVKTEGKGRKKK